MDYKFKIRPIRQGFSVRFIFARPILRWENVGGRFLTTLYDNLSAKIPIHSSEISMSNGPGLADIWIKYSIFGGANSIMLSADRIVLDFPSVNLSDYPLALEIVRISHDKFPPAFTEQGCDRIETQTLEHLDLVAPGDIDRFLGKFRIPELDAAFGEVAVTQIPSVKFGLISERQNWQFSLMAERSVLSATAIFVHRALTLRPVDMSSSFDAKYELAQSATLRTYSALGLELETDGASA